MSKNGTNLKPFHETVAEAVQFLYDDLHTRTGMGLPVIIGCICVITELAADSTLPKGVAGKLASKWVDLPTKIHISCGSLYKPAADKISEQVAKLRERQRAEEK